MDNSTRVNWTPNNSKRHHGGKGGEYLMTIQLEPRGKSNGFNGKFKRQFIRQCGKKRQKKQRSFSLAQHELES
jgi:hypothetical protein